MNRTPIIYVTVELTNKKVVIIHNLYGFIQLAYSVSLYKFLSFFNFTTTIAYYIRLSNNNKPPEPYNPNVHVDSILWNFVLKH